jgi:two-component system chemotaxis sensor kinase CheA
MSQDFMDPEIFADFIIEAKEHLETIEPNLLELEKAPENLNLLNEIFRPMHSLKGASGFLGLNKINVLAHNSENVLDELRKGNMHVTEEIMDVILSATDLLRTMIDNLESDNSEGNVDTAPLNSTLEVILSGEEAAPPAAPSEEASSEAVAAPVEPLAEADAPLEAAAEELHTYSLSIAAKEHLEDFLEEAFETVEGLNAALVEIEKSGENEETVNNIFRWFHNLKGNSGIIGFKDLNELTHEAETLLNAVRKGEISATQGMIDVLLVSVDAIEQLLHGIDKDNGTATAKDNSVLIDAMRETVETGVCTFCAKDVHGGVEEPAAEAEQEAAAEGGQGETAAENAPENAPKEQKAEPAAKEEAPAADESCAFDAEDVEIFKGTVEMQMQNITVVLKELEENADQMSLIDGLYRSLTTIRNSAGYMGFEDIKTNADRTAGLVDQARKSDVGFDLMLDILKQECGIIEDQTSKAIESLVQIPASCGGDASENAEANKPEQNASEASAEAKAEENKEQVEAAAPVEQVEETSAETAETAPKEVPEPVQEAKAEPTAEAKAEPEAKPAAKPEENTKTEPKTEAKATPAPKTKAAAAPKPAASAPAAQADGDKQKPRGSSTIRVDHEKLDHLMNLIGELIINRNRFSMLARSLEEGEQQDVPEIAAGLTETTYAMARISDDLQDTIMKVRMVPVANVFSKFPRLVRDLSRKSGKKVELVTDGEETELDKSVVEVIGDPLVHLLRNSMDHGLEHADERVKAGKDEVGKVYLRAYHRGNSVAIEIEDDGRGIDPDKMRAVAVKKELMSEEEAKALDDNEAIELIFAPGFSSAEKITDISGRGVGMDVVRTNIKNLKGSVNVESVIGKGTKFTLTLPLTLAIIDALMVTVAGETYAIPLDAVSETTKLEAANLTEVNNRKAVTLRGEVLGIVDLSEMLELPKNEDERAILPTVVIQDNQRRLGLVVDRLLERQEIVIKPLGDYLGVREGISGATIMGDGSVVLILDPHEIYRLATSKAA